MNLTYPAIIHKDDESYWIEFPDIEGCHSFADSLEEIFKSAKEALSVHCTTLLELGKKLPTATKISEIKHAESDILALIEAPVTDKARSVKKTLTIPAWLNTEAESNGVNFSQVLQEALVQRLGL